MVNGWKLAEYTDWNPIEYELWNVVKFDGSYYTLMSLEGFDNNKNPLESENWGAIADYDPQYNVSRPEIG